MAALPPLVDAEDYLGPLSASAHAVVEAALDLAAVGPDDVFYDLGCNDGRLLVAAAKRGARCVGVELDAVAAARASAAVAAAGLTHLVSVTIGNALDTPLAPATVVFLYLLPKGNARLAAKLQSELAWGRARVVTSLFRMPPPWLPAAQGGVSSTRPGGVDTSAFTKVYLYTQPPAAMLPDAKQPPDSAQ